MKKSLVSVLAFVTGIFTVSAGITISRLRAENAELRQELGLVMLDVSFHTDINGDFVSNPRK
jgi:hypothetical protein